MEQGDRRWLTIFVCQCPNCGYPRVEYVLPSFEPNPQYLRELKLGMLECERCREKFRPLPLECHHTTVEMTLKKDFQLRSEDK